uniref:Uncharacterized protein n=1 Tax=Babesia bovis TaxID=5865 RepID=S6AZC0_BABBO|nr:hypothetical protein [Babesia bovis]
MCKSNVVSTRATTMFAISILFPRKLTYVNRFYRIATFGIHDLPVNVTSELRQEDRLH